MLKQAHVMLAYLTAAGFVVRLALSWASSSLLAQKWLRIAPHVVDTLLLALGVALAVSLSVSPVEGWLGAKLVALIAYIALGVVAMRTPNGTAKALAGVGALAALGYLFLVAFSRNPWPF